MANININFSEGTDAVVTTASEISTLADDFFREYTQLYNMIETDLVACWKGEDADAFKTKVEGEKHFFETMRDVINEYSTFLRNTANAHEARKEDSKSGVASNCAFE